MLSRFQSPRGEDAVPYEIVHGDCLEWLERRKPTSIHAVVTDPPYALKEYHQKELQKLRNGNRGGVWRIPPKLGGIERSPVPRFTVLTNRELNELRGFFSTWARLVERVLVPGGHLFIASSPILSHHLYAAILTSGLEKRGEVVRLVRTLRGGDRPKLSEGEFSGVSVIARSAWEPWGIFRKPFEGRASENLRRWKAGALRRPREDVPFVDVIPSERTPGREREIASHPSLKPQRFLRQVVCAALPLGEGLVLDPFAGSGSTLAAAEAVGYRSIGIEKDAHYVQIAKMAIPKLAALYAPASVNSFAIPATGELKLSFDEQSSR